MVLFILVGLSSYVIFSDVTRRLIANWLVVLIGSFSLYSGWGSFVWLPYSIVLLSLLLLFALGFLGGGDVKLLLGYLLGIDLRWWSTVFLLVTFIGGLMAVAFLSYGYLANRADEVRKRGLPYGVPIAIGGCFGVWLTSIS